MQRLRPARLICFWTNTASLNHWVRFKTNKNMECSFAIKSPTLKAQYSVHTQYNSNFLKQHKLTNLQSVQNRWLERHFILICYFSSWFIGGANFTEQIFCGLITMKHIRRSSNSIFQMCHVENLQLILGY